MNALTRGSLSFILFVVAVWAWANSISWAVNSGGSFTLVSAIVALGVIVLTLQVIGLVNWTVSAPDLG